MGRKWEYLGRIQWIMCLYGAAEIGKHEDVSRRESWQRALLSGEWVPLVGPPDTGVSRCSRHRLSLFKLVKGEGWWYFKKESKKEC